MLISMPHRLASTELWTHANSRHVVIEVGQREDPPHLWTRPNFGGVESKRKVTEQFGGDRVDSGLERHWSWIFFEYEWRGVLRLVVSSQPLLIRLSLTFIRTQGWYRNPGVITRRRGSW